MINKIEKLSLRVLFGKSALNGYYVSPKEKVSKNYIFDSVFPNRKSMEIALGRKIEEK